jgi:SRSO17 transposase
MTLPSFFTSTVPQKVLVHEPNFLIFFLRRIFLRRIMVMYKSRQSQPSPVPISVPSSFIEGILEKLKSFLEPFFPLVHRSDMAFTAWLYLQGLLSNLPRKSAEPIAEMHDLDRKVLQRFVGVSPWDDRLIREKMVEDVAKKMGDPSGVLCLDPSAFPKKGTKSVGVKRQWCGRTGKKDNCQVGVFGSYASPQGRCLLDTQLYLPKEWCEDKKRLTKCRVPETRTYLKHWELALEVFSNISKVPHACVLADAEFGRCGEFRDCLARQEEHYVLDIPVSLNIRVVEKNRPTSKPINARTWLKSRSKNAWIRVKTREGSRGSRIFEACRAEVLTERKDGTFRRETLLAIRPIETPHDVKLLLAWMPKGTSLEEMVQYGTRRWTIEDCLMRAKSECGMGQYEVRSWVGWHHHMTMAMLATWLLEELRISKTGNSESGKSFPPSDLPTFRIYTGRAHFQARFGSRTTGEKDIETPE